MSDQHVVVVPVKPPGVGKSRLSDLGDGARRDLAAAFAADTVQAALRADGVARVLVTTDDAGFARMLGDLGAETLPDGAAGDLNAALVQAVAEAGRRWPALRPVAVCADLPALRPDALARVLAALAVLPGQGFVPDAAGTGTTVYGTATTSTFAPRFGPGSRAAHRAAGAVEVGLDEPTARRDVDDVADLEDARVLGVGAATTAAVATLHPGRDRSLRDG